MSFPTSPQRHLRLLFLALAAAALAVLATASAASAAPASGDAVLTLKKGAKSSLLREGVKVTPSSGKGKAQTVKLAAADLDLGSKVIETGSALTVKGNGTSIKLNDVQLKVGPKSTAISAKQGGKRKVFFSAEVKPLQVAVALSGKGPLALTGGGAKALGAALGLDGITAGRVGSLSFSSALTPAPEPKPTPEPAKPADPYPYASQCPVPSVANPGFGSAPGKVAGIAALPTFQPGTEQTVTGTAVKWGFKQSFRGYVLNAPPSGTLQPLDGASASAVGPGMAGASAYFNFPAASGSYEAGNEPDHSDDRLVSKGTGTVLFCKPGHGFDIVIRNPTVVLDGGKSRITAEVGANMNGTWYPFQQVDIADLDLDAATPVLSESGNKVTWTDIPATWTADGIKATGLSTYKAGEGMDPITVEAKLERPVTQCTIASGNFAPTTAVTFNNAALPTLTSPFVIKGSDIGVINWGFRGSLRASVAGSGTFQLLGGATKAFENMGGEAAVNAPTGRVGKYFSFPVDRYEWEVGTADPKDDRLVATSSATVGFCNPNAGNYGIAISKPTLVIDGANSRLVANSYSWQAGKGWVGGRVDIVELDTSTVESMTEGSYQRWGEIPAPNAPLLNGIPTEGGLLTNAFGLANLVAGAGAGGFDPVSARIALP